MNFGKNSKPKKLWRRCFVSGGDCIFRADWSVEKPRERGSKYPHQQFHAPQRMERRMMELNLNNEFTFLFFPVKIVEPGEKYFFQDNIWHMVYSSRESKKNFYCRQENVKASYLFSFIQITQLTVGPVINPITHITAVAYISITANQKRFILSISQSEFSQLFINAIYHLGNNSHIFCCVGEQHKNVRQCLICREAQEDDRLV